jgi:hypothetical protein
MRILALLSLTLLTSISFAGEIITDGAKIEALQGNLRTNPYYRKIGPAKFSISRFDIGGPTTPFYLEGSAIKRFFKDDNKCFELTIQEKKNIARKVRCFDKTKELQLKNFEEFKVVEKSDLLTEGLEGFTTNAFSQSYKLLAYLHEYGTYMMDRAIFGEEIEKLAPKREFNVDLAGMTEIKINEKDFEIKQQLNLKVGKIGILLIEKSASRSNVIKQEAGGLLFSNGQGRVLIYNPYLRSPFGTHELVFNQKLPILLNQLAQDSLKAPVCFRDNHLRPTAQDCHKLIFNTQSLGGYKPAKIIEVDFVKQEVIFRGY